MLDEARNHHQRQSGKDSANRRETGCSGVDRSESQPLRMSGRTHRAHKGSARWIEFGSLKEKVSVGVKDGVVDAVTTVATNLVGR